MNRISLNDISLSHFRQWHELIKYFILSILFLAFILIYYSLILGENLYQYKSLIDEEKKLKTEFELKHRLTNLKAYQTQFLSLDKIHKNKLNKLVKSNEISSLLNEISQAALSSDLIFEFFAPKTENNSEFPKILSLSMVMIGEYPNLVHFLNRISTLKKLIVFDNFSINRKESDNKKSNLLRMKIRVKIHKYS